MTRAIVSALVFAALLPVSAIAAQIFSDMPDVILADERYVIYSHGLIVEGDNPTPISPQFGRYDFPAIKSAIFSDGNFNLIAHHRAKNTDITEYVTTLESWVMQLINAGVKPSRITLIGFSRGGYLTALTSARLNDYKINTALLAACSDGDISQNGQPVVLAGHLLNIYETTDVVGACGKLSARSKLLSFQEIAITTNRKHGAFFQPLTEWIEPLKIWIDKTNR